MNIIIFFVSVFLPCLPLLHSVNTSMPICPQSFSCPYLSPFKYPFYNVTETQCGLIKITCRSTKGTIQLGGESYEIFGKDEPDNKSSTIGIYNGTFDNLVKNNSCEVLMNNITFPSTNPLIYSISIRSTITLFKCTKNLNSDQIIDTYFNTRNYKSYNACEGYTYYFDYYNGIVPRGLPSECQVVLLPKQTASSPGLDGTNIFSLISSTGPSLMFQLSPTCYDCSINGSRCDTKNGHAQCSDNKNTETPPGEVTPVNATVIGNQTHTGRKRSRLIFVLVAAVIVLGVGSLVVIVLYLKRKAERRNMAMYNVKAEMFLKKHEFLAPKRYSYSEVKKMTNSFKAKLGQGGFGVVYKGVLRNQKHVAVKILSEVQGEGEDFINEVASVGRTSHVNIVSLVGFCLEGRQKALIYEFMPNGSLERFIFNCGSSSSSQLGWEKLHQIAIGIARGLEYLHKGCNTRILHLDIKPHNILLDNDFCPKISDFGLAKLFREKESKMYMSHLRGTPGYIAPELFFRNFGDVSHKSDVYSYGMMILEMVGGRQNIEVGVDHTSDIYFPHWIYKKVELNEKVLGLHDIVCDEENMIASKMIIVGLWCIQTNPLNRPTITRVLEMLEGDLASLEIPPKPYLCSPPRSPGFPHLQISCILIVYF